jgi:hypothetical protein
VANYPQFATAFISGCPRSLSPYLSLRPPRSRDRPPSHPESVLCRDPARGEPCHARIPTAISFRPIALEPHSAPFLSHLSACAAGAKRPGPGRPVTGPAMNTDWRVPRQANASDPRFPLGQQLPLSTPNVRHWMNLDSSGVAKQGRLCRGGNPLHARIPAGNSRTVFRDRLNGGKKDAPCPDRVCRRVVTAAPDIARIPLPVAPKRGIRSGRTRGPADKSFLLPSDQVRRRPDRLAGPGRFHHDEERRRSASSVLIPRTTPNIEASYEPSFRPIGRTPKGLELAATTRRF